MSATPYTCLVCGKMHTSLNSAKFCDHAREQKPKKEATSEEKPKKEAKKAKEDDANS